MDLSGSMAASSSSCHSPRYNDAMFRLILLVIGAIILVSVILTVIGAIIGIMIKLALVAAVVVAGCMALGFARRGRNRSASRRAR
jgi:UPF0716 family protein affecting phage T7 exclusion